MFAVHRKKINPSVLYNQLTQVETLELTQERLCQYLLNILPGDINNIQLSTIIKNKDISKRKIMDYLLEFTPTSSLDTNNVIKISLATEF